MCGLKIAAVSDLHGPENFPEIPKDCDYLIIAGDLLPETSQQSFWETKCIPWFKNLEWLRKIFLVGGNHDNLFEKQGSFQITQQAQAHKIYNLVYLDNRLYIEKDFILNPEYREYELKIYGSPYTTGVGYMAFSRNTFDFLDSIPERLDILITHASPEMEETKHIYYDEVRAGEKGLNKILHWKRPRILVCGHVHYPCTQKIGATTVYNVSRSTHKENILSEPIIIEIEI